MHLKQKLTNEEKELNELNKRIAAKEDEARPLNTTDTFNQYAKIKRQINKLMTKKEQLGEFCRYAIFCNFFKRTRF